MAVERDQRDHNELRALHTWKRQRPRAYLHIRSLIHSRILTHTLANTLAHIHSRIYTRAYTLAHHSVRSSRSTSMPLPVWPCQTQLRHAQVPRLGSGRALQMQAQRQARHRERCLVTTRGASAHHSDMPARDCVQMQSAHSTVSVSSYVHAFMCACVHAWACSCVHVIRCRAREATTWP